ncbi:hypothetical protein [Sphingobacterium corticibacterium]|uniref:Uncharacterized protein n=1 Tax=Sphingobacterium corticibacterium TaxID=2484746 RepID=A0A4Q6XP33_9SPHI|nr:hypothetical protein [Sphingobacterium corticibacterium]RZF61691.1 hypothetical protein EWE74_02290 [Sphingobacterium corticibacterium]
MLMVTYGQAVLSFSTILLHASVIEQDGQGYAFLGKSGTGKSTHSRLWLLHIPNAALLNDDNPAIRWNRQLYNRIVNHLEKVVANVRIGQLTCLPDRTAAQLCYQKLTHHKNK